jgi:hypothetical protein
MTMPSGKLSESRTIWDSGTVLSNEFAAVRVSVDRRGHSPRLLVEDLTTGNCVLLEPLEMASFCLALDEDRDRWLLVGDYRRPEHEANGYDGTGGR